LNRDYALAGHLRKIRLAFLGEGREGFLRFTGLKPIPEQGDLRHDPVGSWCYSLRY
jgi:hypothetical protein